MLNALSLYCHLISHAADYRLCLDVSAAQRDAFLIEDLTRIARTVFEVDGMRIVVNAHISKLLACDWFATMRWHADVLAVFSFQFDYGHAQAAKAICNLVLAAVHSSAVLGLSSWLAMLPVNAPKDCLAILDPSRGENGVSVWRTLYLHVWDRRYWNTHEVLAFLLRLAQRMHNCDAAPTGEAVCELFAPDCIATVLRQLAHPPGGNAARGELDSLLSYTDWHVARSLLLEMRHMLPAAWPELWERLLDDNGDDIDLVRISLLVQELEVDVSASVRDS